MPNGFRLAQLPGSSHFSLVTACPFRRPLQGRAVPQAWPQGRTRGCGTADLPWPTGACRSTILPLWSLGSGLGSKPTHSAVSQEDVSWVASLEVRIHGPRGGQSDPGGDQLLEQLRERMEAGPCHFHVLVPATPVDQLSRLGSRDPTKGGPRLGGGLGWAAAAAAASRAAPAARWGRGPRRGG
jgi:hypothetical protein